MNERGMDYGMPDGTIAHLYGGMSYRWWAGTRGQSELVAGVAQFWQRVDPGDQEAFEESLIQQTRTRVAQAVGERWGLWMSPESPSLDRLEYLWIWDPEPDMLDRLHAYEAGISAMLPPGARARDLSAADVGQLARRMGLKQPSDRRVGATTDMSRQAE